MAASQNAVSVGSLRMPRNIRSRFFDADELRDHMHNRLLTLYAARCEVTIQNRKIYFKNGCATTYKVAYNGQADHSTLRKPLPHCIKTAAERYCEIAQDNAKMNEVYDVVVPWEAEVFSWNAFIVGVLMLIAKIVLIALLFLSLLRMVDYL